MDLVLEAFDGEGGVVTTEAKAVAEDSVDFSIDADVGSVVEIEVRLGMLYSPRPESSIVQTATSRPG